MYILTEEKEIQLYNVLEKLYVNFEKDIIDNPKRISNVISDLLPDYTKEQLYIKTAVVYGVFADLIKVINKGIIEQKVAIIKANDIMVDKYGFQEEISVNIINLFALVINLESSIKVESQSYIQKKIMQLSEVEKYLFRIQDLFDDVIDEIVGLDILNDDELQIVIDKYERKKPGDTKLICSSLKKLTSECLVEWSEFNSKNGIDDILQRLDVEHRINDNIQNYSCRVFGTKVYGIGIILVIIADFSEIHKMREYSFLNIQDNKDFKLSSKWINLKKGTFISLLDLVYPKFEISSTFVKEYNMLLGNYIDKLSLLERRLYEFASSSQSILENIESDNNYWNNDEVLFLKLNNLSLITDKEIFERIVMKLSNIGLINWVEFDVYKIENGYEGIYISKIMDTGIVVYISMLYRDERRAAVGIRYAMQKLDYHMGDSIKILNVIDFRDCIRNKSDVFSLNGIMKKYLGEKAIEIQEEQRKQEELKIKITEKKLLDQIPKINIYDLFVTHDIPGLKRKSIYELYIDNRKKYEELISKQIIILDDFAKAYIESIDEGEISIKQKFYGLNNCIVAQLELHDRKITVNKKFHHFIMPDSEIQKAIDMRYVEVKIGSLYSNNGWEYYEILYGDKIIKSTKKIAGGGRGKWMGRIISQ